MSDVSESTLYNNHSFNLMLFDNIISNEVTTEEGHVLIIHTFQDYISIPNILKYIHHKNPCGIYLHIANLINHESNQGKIELLNDRYKPIAFEKLDQVGYEYSFFAFRNIYLKKWVLYKQTHAWHHNIIGDYAILKSIYWQYIRWKSISTKAYRQYISRNSIIASADRQYIRNNDKYKYRASRSTICISNYCTCKVCKERYVRRIDSKTKKRTKKRTKEKKNISDEIKQSCC